MTPTDSESRAARVGSGRRTSVPSENRCAQCGALLEPGDIFCGECGFIGRMVGRHAPDAQSTVAVPRLDGDSAPLAARATADLRPREDAPSLPRAESVPSTSDVRSIAPPPVDDEAEEYLLQFSTGESVLVVGTGLIGRNPREEPGESLDTRVIISDPGRTVSKTHLEFGQEQGALWIRDRYSGNGTSIVGLDNTQRRLDAGKRYLVGRGMRVYIGEQYFYVR